MQNISLLRDAGYVFQRAMAAVNSTELSRDVPFWYYNPVLGAPNVRNFGEIEAAPLIGARYCLVVSGDYLESTEFPVAIVNGRQMDALRAARAKYFLHRNEAEVAEDDFDGVLTAEAACEAER